MGLWIEHAPDARVLCVSEPWWWLASDIVVCAVCAGPLPCPKLLVDRVRGVLWPGRGGQDDLHRY
jgi:hypothetical protein